LHRREIPPLRKQARRCQRAREGEKNDKPEQHHPVAPTVWWEAITLQTISFIVQKRKERKSMLRTPDGRLSAKVARALSGFGWTYTALLAIPPILPDLSHLYVRSDALRQLHFPPDTDTYTLQKCDSAPNEPPLSRLLLLLFWVPVLARYARSRRWQLEAGVISWKLKLEAPVRPERRPWLKLPTTTTVLVELANELFRPCARGLRLWTWRLICDWLGRA
jgi:hypothetical protein